MGFLDFLFKRKNKNKTQGNPEGKINPSKETSLAIKGIDVHPEIRDLLWIGEGYFKNYSQEANNKTEFEIDGILFTISFYGSEEPSLIYPSQRVTKSNITQVERPPYYPTYSGLSPAQKWVYANLLSNPYNPEINIGFVFILYYGLERHLLLGNFEQAFEVILKLRDVHSNSSFQSYSAKALILSCILHKRPDLILRFIDSLDKDHEFNFSDNLFLLCCYSFNIPIPPFQLMKMSKSFDHSNQNYIKKEPELFVAKIEENLKREYGTKELILKDLLESKGLQSIKTKKELMFANVSIRDQEIPVPQIITEKSLKSAVHQILKSAHEDVKKHLAEMRKEARKKAKTDN
ncbi:MAG: TerB N-terminal domain-containing protein [Balneolaceae bacterium]|nr:TerB N-terminal domain-containing protein [Balneolaceae bacterium]